MQSSEFCENPEKNNRRTFEEELLQTFFGNFDLSMTQNASIAQDITHSKMFHLPELESIVWRLRFLS